MSHWCTIAPIVSVWRGPSFHFAEPVDVGCGVRLIRAPDWLRDDDITRLMSSVGRAYVEQARFALSIDYEADSHGDPDPAWTRQAGMSKQDVAVEKIRLVNLSLWLARPSWLGFEMVIDVREDQGAWILRRVYDGDPIRPLAEEAENTLALADLEYARTVAESALVLPIRSAPWRSLMLLWRSLAEIDGHNRYLFLWIGLEALFGPTNASEITYRLSQRLAFFVAESRAAAGELYRRAKEAYSLRSKIVHGFRVASLETERSAALLTDSECGIRTALRKIIVDAGFRHMFEDERRREAFLDGLAFSGT